MGFEQPWSQKHYPPQSRASTRAYGQIAPGHLASGQIDPGQLVSHAEATLDILIELIQDQHG